MFKEDITYCGYSECPNTYCERHSSHIKNQNELHSYAFFECVFWNLKKRLSSKEKQE